MDTLIYSVLRITILVLILRTLFRLFSYPRSKAFLFQRKRTQEETGTTHTLSADQSKPEQPDNPRMEKVLDKICQKEILRHQAYILLDENEEHLYFSSWECRQKFLDAKRDA